ncbi:MFS transporter [Fodinisporobacter ferrooxydans]|uniref:MFS transporter n=1 Tax=Fodinisporobacter ferrooxydans TaxID=2901836 RepID=A0ABY4CQW8_9BACL|nr:MFS transporter [Alicyclobacillaceae bacterium MYW30-H2]
MEYTQRGRYRWVVFFTIAISYFMVFSQRTAPGLITDTLMRQFHITASALGILTGIQYLAYMSLQIPLGMWADRFGPARFLILGTALDGIGTIFYSMAPNAVVLLASRLFVGIGDAMIWINIVLVLSQWFRPAEFASLLGWTGMSGSLGAVLTTVPLSLWIASAGWRLPFLSLGILLMCCSILLYFVLVKGPKQSPAGTAKSSNELILKAHPSEKGRSVLSRIVKRRQAWATFLCHFGLVGTYIGFIGSWAVPFSMDVYGMSRMNASELVSLGLLGAIIGGPLTGFVSDRMQSRKRPYFILHAITFLSWLLFIILGGKPPLAVLIPLFILIGVGNGGSMLTFAYVRETFSITEVGVASGFANTGGFLSAVTLPFVLGAILDHMHALHALQSTAYQFAFTVPACFALVGWIGSMMMSENKEDESSFPTSSPLPLQTPISK